MKSAFKATVVLNLEQHINDTIPSHISTSVGLSPSSNLEESIQHKNIETKKPEISLWLIRIYSAESLFLFNFIQIATNLFQILSGIHAGRRIFYCDCDMDFFAIPEHPQLL